MLELLLVTIFIATLHHLALTYFLYWTFDWFDILMHFLGGLTIGLFALYVFFTSGYVKYPNDHWVVVLSVTVGAVLIVGLVWELWELFVGFTDVLQDRGDTILDLIMDTLGALCAYYYGKNKIRTWQGN